MADVNSKEQHVDVGSAHGRQASFEETWDKAKVSQYPDQEPTVIIMSSADPEATDPGQSTDPEEPETRQTFHERYSALKPFVIMSSSYLLYTVTDGAIRMIVLLHAYTSGFSAWEVAIMFSAYECAGIFTNLAAGTMGARWGIKTTLLTGLTLQLVGIGSLYGWQDSWSEDGQKWKAIVFVTMTQMLCGIAKDLTKLGGKTVTKLVTPDEKQSSLFKLVSLITGWKNSLKGVGYFIGSASITYNYNFALGLLLGLILLAMPWAIIGLSDQLGRARSKNLSLFEIFKQRYNVNILSVSRFFLFGARDMWFEVPLPFFLRDSVRGLGWSRPITGLFLALWIIGYGQVQSWTPQLALQPLRQSPANKLVAVFWNIILISSPVIMGGLIQSSSTFLDRNLPGMEASMIVGLAWFALVFAINSSIHSYLIVRYADGDKVALNIGFYYTANAMGRLTGTLVSGALYSFVDRNNVLPGFAACFWTSTAFVAASALVECLLRDQESGLKLGPCLTLIAPDDTIHKDTPKFGGAVDPDQPVGLVALA
mmetsp:Transcript_4544/g.7749  ORF Transcript_4544/g.7749 Transcript_4544/m.7749 type:complete len:538 (-) Transcript_4544:591-2204(-)